MAAFLAMGAPALLLADRVWDGVSGDTIERGFLAIEDGTIAAVGRQADLGSRLEQREGVVDMGASSLIPGLVDCHQHLCFDGNGTLEDQVVGIDDDALTARARAAASRALAGGVTTLRDLGDRSFLTLPLRGDPSLPTIVVSGPPLTSVGGHCWYLGGECADDDALARAVAGRVERGCDVVKVMVTGGGLTPTFPMWDTQFTDDQLRAIVDAAHDAGLPVAAHCHGVAGIVQSLDAGADSIEHCTFMTSSGRCEPVDVVLERLAASGVAVSATVGRVPGLPVPPLIANNLDVIVAIRQRLHELGAVIVAGTDAGISPAKPHDVARWALADLVDSGMTPTDGLRALTSVAATVCGVGHRKGRLAPGFDADVLAVAGDPFVEPAAVLDVTGVWRAGRQVVGPPSEA